MKRTFWLALAAVLATMTLAVGTTLALFTDTVRNDTDFTAGTLCLHADRNDSDPVPGPMFYVTAQQGQTPGGQLGTLPTGFWAPGDVHNRTLIVSNPTACSTMGAWLETVWAETTLADVSLAEKLMVEITTSRAGLPGDFVVAQGTLKQFLDGAIPLRYPDTTRIPLPLNSIRFLHFKVTLDLSLDNSYQGKELKVDFKINGVQSNNNP